MKTGKLELLIGKLLFFGVLISFFFVMTGGICYLLQHGNEIAISQTFHNESHYASLRTIFSDALSFSPQSMIQFGLFILVITQILRVLVTTWLFIQSRERCFILISSFILFVLVYSLV